MTIQQIVQRLKAQRESDVVEQVRTLLADVLGEHTVYKPTSRWQEILSDIGMKNLENRAVCVTCYGASPDVFQTIKSTLKKKFKVVTSAEVDDLGFRQIFIAGQSSDAEPELLLLANYYEEAREVVKSMYNEGTSDNAASVPTDAEDIDIELGDEDIGDPFA